MTAGISTSNSQKHGFMGRDQTKDISCHQALLEQRERDVDGGRRRRRVGRQRRD